MSDLDFELSMTEKLEMLRTASAKGMVAGETGLADRRSPLFGPADELWPYSSRTSYTEMTGGSPESTQGMSEPDSLAIDRTRTPFKITVTDTGSGMTWRVSSELASITDGTNGPSIDLSGAGFDADISFSSEKYIALQADVSSSLVLSNWTLAGVSLSFTDEVKITTSAPFRQEKLRLLIGRVAIVSGKPKAYQAVTTPKIIVTDFYQGMLCKVFSDHSFHPDFIV